MRELQQASSLGEACTWGRADMEDKMGGLRLRNGMCSDEGQDAQWTRLELGTREDQELSGPRTIGWSLRWSWPRKPERRP